MQDLVEFVSTGRLPCHCHGTRQVGCSFAIAVTTSSEILLSKQAYRKPSALNTLQPAMVASSILEERSTPRSSITWNSKSSGSVLFDIVGIVIEQGLLDLIGLIKHFLLLGVTLQNTETAHQVLCSHRTVLDFLAGTTDSSLPIHKSCATS